jgi:hypothetical protein
MCNIYFFGTEFRGTLLKKGRVMDKPYSILVAPIVMFTSGKFYRDIYYESKGTGFGYLLLLLAVSVIFYSITINTAINKVIVQDVPGIVKQIPHITIDKGKASIDRQQPYYINDPDTHKPLIILDTTGAINSLENSPAIGLLKENEMLFKHSEVETRSYSFESIEHFELTQAKTNHWLDLIKKYLVIALYPFIVFAFFVMYIIKVLIYALIGLLFALLLKTKRDYLALMRMSVVAVTPVIIIKTIIDLSSVSMPMPRLSFFILAMIFLFFGVRAASLNRQPAAEAENQENM